jgi:subtilase family serine protease
LLIAMMFRSLILATFAVNCRTAVVHKEPELPAGWATRALNHPSIKFRASLKQRNLDRLTLTALRVSDPADSMYGKYLTRQEIENMTAPSQSAVRTALDWATSVDGCSASVSREVVFVKCSKESAEQLLATVCHEARNDMYKQSTIRCADYMLPDEVHEVVQAMYGLHGLPLPPKPARKLDPPAAPVKVTPDVITTTYKVSGVTASGSEKNRQAVAEFQGQTMSSADLAKFWTQFVPKAPAEQGKVHKFVGDPGEGGSETEADLDVQYIMGVAPGILTEFWYYKPSDFCGDLKNWTHSIMSADDPPLVHSVSYGWQGNMTTLSGCLMANVNDVDAEFAKLAARGITIVFASGDSGAGYSPPHAQCGSAGNPPPGTMKGKSLTGVNRTRPASSLTSCCEIASEEPSKGWTYKTPKGDTCATQTILKGIMFDGESLPTIQDSQDACCAHALALQRSAWSHNSASKECNVFYEVNGRHLDPSSISAIGTDIREGECSIFSEVTGTEDDPQSSSATPGKATFHLYPSWPASSPWVTSVGSTRFVDQKVGQPEMSTDQFGSGGGFSDMFDAFDDQKASISKYFSVAPQLPPAGSFPKTGRATPDVSGLGEGYQVMIRGAPQSVGGTSASAPMFAGLVSLLNEARIAKGQAAMGYLNPWIYKNAAAFTDVTRGDNFHGRGPFVEPYGFNCTVGWDPSSGVGTPNFEKMLAAALAPSSIVV